MVKDGDTLGWKHICEMRRYTITDGNMLIRYIQNEGRWKTSSNFIWVTLFLNPQKDVVNSLIDQILSKKEQPVNIEQK